MRSSTGLPLQPSLTERLAFGLGDTACNLVWAMMFNFALYFYTDIFQIPAVAAGAILLGSQVAGGGFDLCVGRLADKTMSRWGRFRPYLLVGSVPLAVMFVLTFTAAPGDGNWRIAYACLTYGLLMLSYSVVNIPYGALTAAMTDDADERLRLNAFRMLGGQLGAVVVGSSFLPLVARLGAGAAAAGATRTVTIYATATLILLFTTFWLVRERVSPPSGGTTPDSWSAFARANPHWLLLLATGLGSIGLLVLQGATAVYYLRHLLHWQDGLISWWFVIAGLATVAGTVLTARAVVVLGRRWAMVASLAAMAASAAPLFWLPAERVAAVLACHAVAMAANGIHCTLYWTLLADTVDFAEWSCGARPTGVMFSAGTCAQKMGLGLGAALAGAALAFSGYDPDGPQPPRAAACIQLLMSLVPAAGYALLALGFSRYSLDERLCRRVREDLAARRAGA